jgi:type-F conjugative transfer system pilin assembly protein TrbC
MKLLILSLWVLNIAFADYTEDAKQININNLKKLEEFNITNTHNSKQIDTSISINDKKEIEAFSEELIKKSQNLIQTNEFRKDYNLEEIEPKFTDINKQNIMVFISFSMPNNMILEYIEEAKRYNAVLVLRGFIKSESGKQSIPLTVQKISDITNKRGANVIIHPKMFELFQIDKAPAIVRVRGNFECLDNGSLCDERNVLYDKVTGSVSLSYALELFNDL